jgi:acetyltransferase-like isoleucine patch superfamily enzyme
MKEYLQLTDQQIQSLKKNDCWAQDWNEIKVTADFDASRCHRVQFYGWARLGNGCGTVEITEGFVKNCGIYNATLRNVTIGNNCLIENIGNYLNNVTIGDGCYISNVSTIDTVGKPDYGQGHTIAVLNEVGDGNLLLLNELNSQLAALMVKHGDNKPMMDAIKRMVAESVEKSRPACSTIGNHVKVVNSGVIINTIIDDGSQLCGVSRMSNCTISSTLENPIIIRTGVICENTIISGGSRLNGSVKLTDCFVGEFCQLENGFTAASSVFFANSYMSNGEACAAFCGPFTVSHHKSSLLIGAMFSFYNAGSATNFSNHAYKMGPMHYGTLERGCKTASGAYLLLPANVGAFSVLFGKLMYHPDTSDLPFSYLIAYSDMMYLKPGRNFATVGLYRDIRKWPKRDKRPQGVRKSVVNFDWLSPFTISEVLRGKKILENLLAASGDNVSTYNYHEYVIKAPFLHMGIKYYDMALRIYMGAVLKRHKPIPPVSTEGEGNWIDLAGLLMPQTAEEQIIDDIVSGRLDSIEAVNARFKAIDANYNELRWAWSYRIILDYYGIDSLTEEAVERIHQDYVTARREWIALIRKDAENEYTLGDVDREVLEDFVTMLDREVDFENQKLYM